MEANPNGCEPSVTVRSGFKRTLPSDADILNMPLREDRYNALLKAGVAGQELLNRIRAIVLLTTVPLLRKGHWTEGTGKSPKTIKDVPRRVKRFADEIAPLISHSLLAPAFCTDEHSAFLYPRLPDILRAFSLRMEGQISIVSQLVAELNKTRVFSEKLKAHLCEWVGSQTGGKFLYEELSELLSAAYEAEERNGSGRIIARENLKNLHERERGAGWPKPRIIAISLNLEERWVQVTVEP